MTFDTLTFVLRQDRTEHQGADLVVVTPDLYINGHRLLRSAAPVVDTLGLMVHAGHTGSFDLLTCTCGVAGCAGFHEEVTVRADSHKVQWLVPVEGYGDELSAAFGPGPWTFTFERDAYDRALAELEKELLALQRSQGRLALCPWGPYDDDEAVPEVAHLLQLSRTRFARHQRQEECFEQAFGSLAGQDVKLSFCGYVFWLSVRQYAWAATSGLDLPFHPESDEEFEAHAQALRAGALALRQDPRQAVLALSDSQLGAYAHAWNESDNRWDFSLSLESLGGQHRDASLRVELGASPS